MSVATPGMGADVGGLPELNLDSLSGPFVIGTMLALFLQGVTIHQGTVFWAGCRKSREPIIYMLVVGFIQIMDFLHSGFCINTIYVWCVKDYGDPTTLAISPWSFMVEPLCAGIVAVVVHLFYAHRILLIADGHFIGKIAAILISIFTCIQLSFGAAVTSKIVTYNYEFQRFIAWLWGACVWLGTLAVADLIICFTYTYYLNRTAREMSGPFVHSTQLVLKVALIVLATNGCSATVAVIATVLFGSLHNTNWHAIPQLCLQKMLTLSLLVCLNARSLLSDMIGADPSYFHSHLKRQGLGGFLQPNNNNNKVNNPVHAIVNGNTTNGGPGSTVAINAARREQAKSIAGLGGGGGGATASSTSISNNNNVFDVRIDRSPEYTSDLGSTDRKRGHRDDEEMITGGDFGTSSSQSVDEKMNRPVLEEEVSSFGNRQPYARSSSDNIVHPFSNPNLSHGI